MFDLTHWLSKFGNIIHIPHPPEDNWITTCNSSNVLGTQFFLVRQYMTIVLQSMIPLILIVKYWVFVILLQLLRQHTKFLHNLIRYQIFAATTSLPLSRGMKGQLELIWQRGQGGLRTSRQDDWLILKAVACLACALPCQSPPCMYYLSTLSNALFFGILQFLA